MADRGQPPMWQPIEMLASIIRIVAVQAGHTQTQLRLLGQARTRPCGLDHGPLARARRVFTAQRDDLWLLEDQQRRWAVEHQLTARQRGQVEELGRATYQLRQQTEQALALDRGPRRRYGHRAADQPPTSGWGRQQRRQRKRDQRRPAEPFRFGEAYTAADLDVLADEDLGSLDEHVFDTSGCPVAEACAGCGATSMLRVVASAFTQADGGWDMGCATLCEGCDGQSFLHLLTDEQFDRAFSEHARHLPPDQPSAQRKP